MIHTIIMPVLSAFSARRFTVEKFREVFQEEPRSRHREHLFRRIAWRLQALMEGDISERARSRAREIARDADFRTIAPAGFFTLNGDDVRTTPGDRNRRQPDSRLPLPGTLLTRQWKGRTLRVETLKDGFRYDNRQYSSLSAIAVAITGTRWNGLAFFGLTRPAGRSGREQAHAKRRNLQHRTRPTRTLRQRMAERRICTPRRSRTSV